MAIAEVAQQSDRSNKDAESCENWALNASLTRVFVSVNMHSYLVKVLKASCSTAVHLPNKMRNCRRVTERSDVLHYY